MIHDVNEAANGGGESYERGGGKLPKLLGKNPTKAEMVNAINGLALELQFDRQAIAQLGTRIETFSRDMNRNFETLTALVEGLAPKKRTRKPKAKTPR